MRPHHPESQTEPTRDCDVAGQSPSSGHHVVQRPSSIPCRSARGASGARAWPLPAANASSCGRRSAMEDKLLYGHRDIDRGDPAIHGQDPTSPRFSRGTDRLADSNTIQYGSLPGPVPLQRIHHPDEHPHHTTTLDPAGMRLDRSAGRMEPLHHGAHGTRSWAWTDCHGSCRGAASTRGCRGNRRGPGSARINRRAGSTTDA
jgi:hypothetical protein